jgi:hypothetical protein
MKWSKVMSGDELVFIDRSAIVSVRFKPNHEVVVQLASGPDIELHLDSTEEDRFLKSIKLPARPAEERAMIEV